MLDSCYTFNVLLLIGVAWCMMWWIYNYFIRTPAFNPMGTVLLRVPSWIQKLTPHVSTNPTKNDTKLLNLDGWSVGHFLIYASIGLFFPNRYAEIFIISLMCEAYEYVVGWRARWLLDPVVNMLGYIAGSAVEIRHKLKLYSRAKHVLALHSMGCSFSLVGILGLILFANQPKFMKHPSLNH